MMFFNQSPVRGFLLVWLALLPGLLCADESHLAFHAGFDPAAEGGTNTSGAPLYSDLPSYGKGPSGRAAVSIPVGGQLVYEGAGNAWMPSGTVSFWWRLDEPAQETEAEVLNISSFQRFDFCRWLRITTRNGQLQATLYHGESAEATDEAEALPGDDAARVNRATSYRLATAKPPGGGGWHHVALTWDFGRGFALYLDGQLEQQVKQPWYFGASINHLSLACRSTAYFKPSTATMAQSFADVRIYNVWLEPGEAAALARGENPQPKADFGPMFRERARRYGLGRGESLPVAPVEAGQALWMRQVGPEGAVDVLRRSFTGLDGDLGRAWPRYQGYSGSGRKLAIRLPAGSRFNTIQFFGSGPMEVKAGSQALLAASLPEASLQSAFLPAAVEAQEVDVLREDGFLWSLSFYQTETRPFPQAGEGGWRFHPLGSRREGAEPLVEQEFAPEDRRTLVAEGDARHALKVPEGAALHLLGPTMGEKQGVGAIAFDLALEEPLPGAADVAVAVVDPVSYERRTALAAFRIAPGATALRLVLDLRDLLYAEGERPWLVLYSGVPLNIDPVHSRLGLHTLPVKEAEKEFFQDQLLLVEDAFQEMSEPRPWTHDPKKIKWLGSLLGRIDRLRQIAPDDPLVRGYWHWTHPREETPGLALPPSPEGVPPWVVATSEAVDRFRQAAYWWIDHRQTPEGEFGAPDGINDDTDLIQDWLAVDLMNGPDPKIRGAVRKVADLSWRLTTTDGVSNKVTDTLHSYEWGINAQTLAFVLEYGDPVYFERLLRFASHYRQWMAQACEGRHLHFRSWYFGAGRIRTEGVYGRDSMINALMLQPAMLLAWYNGDPACMEIVSHWSASMRDHINAQASKTTGVPGVTIEIPSGKVMDEPFFRLAFSDAIWASYRLTGDRSFRDFAGQMIDWEMTRKPLKNVHTTTSILGAYLRETGDPRWDGRWRTAAADPGLWKRSLHNNNYRDLDAFYAAWLRTGEERWLDEGSRLALYHLTWAMPMLTEAGATTDRVWLPQRLANQMTLGGFSLLRNQIFPKHAVSWEGASGRFAPLVRRQADDAMEVEIHNLEAGAALSVGLRAWGLEPGIYDVITRSRPHPDAEAVERRVEREVERYTLLPVKVPAGATATVTFRQKKKLPPLAERPDLAISPLDARYDPETGQLAVRVHNIGARASSAFHVRATQQGRELAVHGFEPLSPPQNFRTGKVQWSVAIENADLPVAFTVRQEKGGREITPFNNRVELIPANLAAAP
ncbi:MAG TPA: LamG-like jellyroll fold domain-containing protein [Chthoniobacteraceae bacterium]|nr:LamG-like jellyroll fold domain-containing protein [Chthoniobacteraceae bacterium]